jgi:hypothetical protein
MCIKVLPWKDLPPVSVVEVLAYAGPTFGAADVKLFDGSLNKIT